jgi:TolB-like protein/Tfp pilus assembly protein PilF
VIAVLPFENLNADPETDYFADGLTDEVIGQLASIDGLHVRSRTSSFTFKGKSRNLRDIGQQLGVNHVVEGSVLRAGTKVRISAKLVTVANDVPLWSEKFDTDLEDILGVLDEIPRAIVNRLRLKLGNRQRRYDTNVAAYDLYLRARALVDQRGGPNLEKAVKLFEQALANDRAFAPAHAGLANAYALLAAPLSSTFPFEHARAKIRQSAERALEIDSLLADAHVAMGWLHAFESDWDNAERAFEQAMKWDPSLTQAYTGYSISTLQPQAKLDEALAILRLALERDPLSLDVEREIGTVQLLMGRYDDAVATLRRVRAQRPDFPFVELFLARALLFAGNVTEALEILERLDGQYLGGFKAPNAKRGPWLALPYVMLGRRAEAEALIDEHSSPPAGLAVVSAALGDHTRAFDALERLAATMPHHLGRTLLLPELAGLRNDQRFAALRKRLNLPAR